jgi:uncharacterized coiled-coil protein SlyX
MFVNEDLTRDELLARIRGLELLNSTQFSQIEDLSRIVTEVNKDLLVAVHLLTDGLRRIEGAIDALEKTLQEPEL